MNKQIFETFLTDKFELSLNSDIHLDNGVISEFTNSKRSSSDCTWLLIDQGWMEHNKDVKISNTDELFNGLIEESNMFDVEYIVVWDIPEQYNFHDTQYVADKIQALDAISILVLLKDGSYEDVEYIFKQDPKFEESQSSIVRVSAKFRLEGRFGG